MTEHLEKDKEKHKRKPVRSSKMLLCLRALMIALILFSSYKILCSSKWYYPQKMFTSPKNKNVAIVGTYITSPEKVLNIMKKVEIPKRPLYMLDVKGFEDKISEIKTVKSVHIRRYWFPARMQIVIGDKMPVLMIAPNETAKPAAFFVEDGTLLGADLLPKNNKLYPLKVITTGEQDNFVKWNKDKIDFFLELAEKVKQYSGEEVEYIDYRQPHNIFIKIKSVLIDLGEPDGNADKRLKSIKTILENLDKVDKKIEYVDLRWEVTKYIKIKGKGQQHYESNINPTEHEIG